MRRVVCLVGFHDWEHHVNREKEGPNELARPTQGERPSPPRVTGLCGEGAEVMPTRLPEPESVLTPRASSLASNG